MKKILNEDEFSDIVKQTKQVVFDKFGNDRIKALKLTNTLRKAQSAWDQNNTEEAMSLLKKVDAVVSGDVNTTNKKSSGAGTFSNVSKEQDKQIFRDRLQTMKVQFREISDRASSVRKVLDQQGFEQFREEFEDAYNAWVNLVAKSDKMDLKEFGNASKRLNDKVRNSLRGKVEKIIRGKLDQWHETSEEFYGDSGKIDPAKVTSERIENDELQQLLSADNFDEQLGLTTMDADEVNVSNLAESTIRRIVGKSFYN